MTRARLPWSRCWRDEGGVAFVLTLMVFLLLAALSSALLSIGGSEVQIAANLLRSTQAQYLAEAGFEDAFNVFRTDPTLIGSAPSTATAVPGLAGPGATLERVGSYTVQYQSAGPNSARVVAVGTTSGSSAAASRAVRALLSFQNRYAMLVNGNLSLSGSANVSGACGNVHANNALSVGGSAIVTGSATASGSYALSGSASVGPGSGGGKRPRRIGAINPGDFLATAQATLPANQIFQMKATGQVLDGSGMPLTLLLPGMSYQGWTYKGGIPATWEYGTSSTYTGVYYLEDNATVSGSPGTTSTPWQTTILATGDVSIPGQPQIQPLLPNTLTVAGGNATISGNPLGGYQGLIAAAGAVTIKTNRTVTGTVIAGSGTVEDALLGSPKIAYDCGLNTPVVAEVTILALGR